MSGWAMLTSDFKEFLQLLNDNNVRYLIVGGVAVALHGYPRYTKDLDIWIEMEPENANRLIQALDQFGFGPLNLVAADFLVEDQIIQLGYPPYRIDLLVTISGVVFSECYPSRKIMNLDGIQVPVIDRKSLLE